VRCKACDRIMEEKDYEVIPDTNIPEDMCLVCKEDGNYIGDVLIEEYEDVFPTWKHGYTITSNP